MTYRLREIDSLDRLRAAAAVWDELWQRSDATLPTLRAELVAQWVEQFAPQGVFRALVVEDQGQWVAALPLVRRKVATVVQAAGMTANGWASCGDLLLDPATETDATLDLLVAALRKLPWPLVWLDEAPLNTSRWQSLAQAFVRTGVVVEWREHYRVGCVEIGHDWEAYRRSWSRKHRQKMAWAARQLAGMGDVELAMLGQMAPQHVEHWLRRGFEIEDRGWKGQSGTSVLHTPGMFSFFLRQAEQLARQGELELVFLRCGGRDIAFVYGMSAKGVFHSCKIGYNPQYARFSPGQMLRYRLLEQFHSQPRRRRLDFQGPLSEAHRAWQPACYAAGRLAAASGPLWGRLLLHAYRCGRLVRHCGKAAAVRHCLRGTAN